MSWFTAVSGRKKSQNHKNRTGKENWQGKQKRGGYDAHPIRCAADNVTQKLRQVCTHTTQPEGGWEVNTRVRIPPSFPTPPALPSPIFSPSHLWSSGILFVLSYTKSRSMFCRLVSASSRESSSTRFVRSRKRTCLAIACNVRKKEEKKKNGSSNNKKQRRHRDRLCCFQTKTKQRRHRDRLCCTQTKTKQRPP